MHLYTRLYSGGYTAVCSVEPLLISLSDPMANSRFSSYEMCVIIFYVCVNRKTFLFCFLLIAFFAVINISFQTTKWWTKNKSIARSLFLDTASTYTLCIFLRPQPCLNVPRTYSVGNGLSEVQTGTGNLVKRDFQRENVHSTWAPVQTLLGVYRNKMSATKRGDNVNFKLINFNAALASRERVLKLKRYKED